MSATTPSAPRSLKSYPVSLQRAAAALWGENFWGREKINPEPDVVRTGSARSRSSA
jgi:hypothetical protein